MRRFLIHAAALAAAATSIAPAAPVAASAASGMSFRPLTYNTNGYNWGGYAATGSGFTSVSATWTEPSAKCNSTNDLYAPWVGIDGYGSSSVEQTGVATDCSSGSPVDQAWYEMYPAAPVYLSSSSYPVKAGDVINASVTYSGSNKYKLTLNDSSRGWTYTTTKTLSASRASAEVIIESPTGAYPNFGTLHFTNAKINGGNLSSYNPTALDPSNGPYEAHTSAISGGTSFTDTFEHE
ncbi:conserved hypothetical protein [Catenulispora acidiphila DSM 44928]|uniref:Peptidase A4 family protein n=1 Tax=Catenulispora acidiphila (strain DSM 44928 / JCM 14897 / NBRC 102108 / NRRL B-24433 / ID139908) TaxID=479433 RepID=C7Q7S1_CATAD|nr:G1 family glutamic endopeptidase [Catenulispora acidiphila]ACU72264.1 conserved hypothetical protein [Catenulispora acidiphila DSM 44928]